MARAAQKRTALQDNGIQDLEFRAFIKTRRFSIFSCWNLTNFTLKRKLRQIGPRSLQKKRCPAIKTPFRDLAVWSGTWRVSYSWAVYRVCRPAIGTSSSWNLFARSARFKPSNALDCRLKFLGNFGQRLTIHRTLKMRRIRRHFSDQIESRIKRVSFWRI